MNIKLRALLGHYSQNHQNKRNQLIHKFAVPMIMFSLLGLLFQLSWHEVNAAWALIIFSLFYYMRFQEWKIYLVIFLQVIPMMSIIIFNPLPPVPFYLSVFILAWIAQFIGHKIEGKKPSFFEDLQYLLIGPLWIFKGVIWKNEL